ncbi:site-specific integrase [Pseudomonas fulva]|uniref:site-specific integrase n=1 Tax=Pseudomonas TaxID=286 RepID=UPI0019D314D0|nr:MULTISPECIES: site-specific integrase [Pseudomonas]MBN6791554.1 site-specific integrase [Pseudomonas fulva]MBN6795629.1 site-specific integrase [Pseudomonas fulva]MBN6857191.1 site-specific integrase [Pseudomonas fulva]MBN6874098.1 site-specific integrase [Pseudomonas fulva]MBN6878535.1 site-specific integrase [Pseudomonas fulva]
MINYGSPVGELSIKKIPFLPLLQPFSKLNKLEYDDHVVESYFTGRHSFEDFQETQKFVPMDETHNDHCDQFPILLNEDGSPWVLGNLYLVKLATDYPQPHHNTLYKTALALQDHWKVLRDERVGMFEFPLRLRRRSTYCYSYHWKRIVDERPEAEGGANEKIYKVTEFYRWAKSENYFSPAHDMWKESERHIVLKNEYGKSYTKVIRVTDLTVKSIAPAPEKKLKPYGDSDQIAIEQALRAIDNTEMSIAFALSLTTSARKQTALTLKRSAFDAYDGQEVFMVKVGKGHSADTKKQKHFKIYIPGWLANQIVTYLKSERYLKRLQLVPAGCDNDYLFITKKGLPYYARRDDPGNRVFQAIPVGKALDAFIRQQLTPRLRDMGYSTYVRFHNLRATYATNFVMGNLELVDKGKMKMTKLIDLVMDKLGQSSREVAERYIGEIQAQQLSYIAQDFMELKLQSMLADGKLEVDHP